MKKNDEDDFLKKKRVKKLRRKMKYSLVIATLILFQLSANTAMSQKKIVLHYNDTPLKQILSEIRSQTGYRFFYNVKEVDDNQRISLNAEGENIREVLKRLTIIVNLDFKINENQVVLTPKKQTSNMPVLQMEITGLVVDTDGAPLPGANVVEKGTTNGTQTDFDGNFSIMVADENAVLEVSYIGFASKEIPLNNQTDLTIILEESAAGLDEVVVVGYGTQRKGDLTGASVKADLASFEEAPNTNILQSLSGTVPGLNVNQVSSAGGNPSIQVRGQTSINGNLSPLIVVDGAIYRGSLNDLNPGDIESVNVLKDASSKAIYGAQAANGVVLVTTKGGKKNQKPIIRYSSYYSTQSPANDLRTLNRNEYIEMQRDLDWRNSYLAPDYTRENPEWEVVDALDVLPPLVEGVNDGTDSDWFGASTGTGFINNHQLTFSGGSEGVKYFVSGGYTKQKNWILNDGFDRKTVRVNLETNLTPWLTFGANTYGSFSDFSGVSPNISGIISQLPFAKIRDENGDFVVNPNGNAGVNGFLVAEAQDKDIRNNISGIFHGVVNVPGIPGFSYRLNYSHNYRWGNRFNSNIYGAGLTGSAFKNVSSTYDWSLDNIIDYKKIVGNHNLGLTLVSGRNRIKYDRTRVNGNGFDNLELGYHSISQAAVQTILSEDGKNLSVIKWLG